MLARQTVDARVKEALARTGRKKSRIQGGHRIIGDLGFDSLRMVALSLALEEAFDRTLLLNDWLAGAPDVGELTVGSLCEYVWEIVNLDG